MFHDVGKANQEFYTAADTNYWGNKQTLRHEWLSALILHLPDVRHWLQESELKLDLEVITAAVLSHHLKATRKEWGQPRPTGVENLELYTQHLEITSILQKIASIARLENIPELPEQWIRGDRLWQQAYTDANKIGQKFGRSIKRDKERKALLLAVKAAIIVADSAASGIFRVKDSNAIAKWVEQTLHRDAITPKEVETKILQPRYRQIKRNLKIPINGEDDSDILKPFQRQAEKLGDRILLLSGCGTGKTIFAYKWMQGVLSRYQTGHLIFLYPTRGTATEGFKDYVSWCPEGDASLLTGTAEYELQQIRANPTDATEGKDYTADARLYSLGFWGKRFFSATVDQFLSFTTHNYGGICLLPVLTDSVVVIDEVHSFSRGMFDKLISFLENFDIPVLCMTATLPNIRQLELTSRMQQKTGQGLTIYPTEEERAKLKELEKAENHPRYFIESTNYDAAYKRAIAAYRLGETAGTRILWVVNTVDRCREIANCLSKELNIEVITYHSRFRLQDRQERHSEAVAAFAYAKDKRNRAIAITTQVCEMSLDLDADILITELAPISALVQRFGRSNRHLSRGEQFLAQVLVYETEKILPYTKKELDLAKEFLQEITGKVSQRYLAEKLEAHSSTDERFADGSSPFTRGGYWAIAEDFRDGNNYTVSAVLDTDLDEVKTLIEKRKPIDGFIVPIPKKYSLENYKDRPEKLPTYIAIASSKLYSSTRGFGE